VLILRTDPKEFAAFDAQAMARIRKFSSELNDLVGQVVVQ
jgi:hypothetical protein